MNTLETPTITLDRDEISLILEAIDMYTVRPAKTKFWNRNIDRRLELSKKLTIAHANCEEYLNVR